MSFRAVSSGRGWLTVAAIGGCLLLACVNRGEHESVGNAVGDGSRPYDARIDRGGSGGARADAAIDTAIDRRGTDAPRDVTGTGGPGGTPGTGGPAAPRDVPGTGGTGGTPGTGGTGAGGSGAGGKTGTGGTGTGGKTGTG